MPFDENVPLSEVLKPTTSSKPSQSGSVSAHSLSSSERSTSNRSPSSLSGRSTPSSSGRSTPSSSGGSTEKVIDILEDFRFHVPKELERCNVQGIYPDEKMLRRFIRDASACLQGVAGSEKITHSDLILAATKICDTLTILRDPKPASFPSARQFPYWVIHQFMNNLCKTFWSFLEKCSTIPDRVTGSHSILAATT